MVLITIDELQSHTIKEIEQIVDKPVYLLYEDTDIPYEEIEIVITYGFEINATFLDKLPNLQWIQVFQTGIEHIPLDEVSKRNIKLTNVRGIYGTPMSEYVMSLILYEVREIARFIQYKKEKKYDRTELVDEVGNKTIGVFGTGRIGQEVAKKAQAFDMNVLGFNTSGRDVEHFDRTYTWDQKDELIKQCDFIVLLLPLTDETYHFLSEHEFNIMKKNAYLINIGRGPLIDKQPLLNALNNNDIKGAALDVFYEEPLPKSSPLWETNNLIITPHLSGKTKYFFDRSVKIFSENFQQFSKNDSLKYEIDLEKGY